MQSGGASFLELAPQPSPAEGRRFDLASLGLFLLLGPSANVQRVALRGSIGLTSLSAAIRPGIELSPCRGHPAFAVRQERRSWLPPGAIGRAHGRAVVMSFHSAKSMKS